MFVFGDHLVKTTPQTLFSLSRPVILILRLATLPGREDCRKLDLQAPGAPGVAYFRVPEWAFRGLGLGAYSQNENIPEGSLF